jgi:hypothetical protein
MKPKPLTEKDIQSFIEGMNDFVYVEDIISALDLLENEINNVKLTRSPYNNPLIRERIKKLIKECFQIKRDK